MVISSSPLASILKKGVICALYGNLHTIVSPVLTKGNVRLFSYFFIPKFFHCGIGRFTRVFQGATGGFPIDRVMRHPLVFAFAFVKSKFPTLAS